jgi:DNA primase
MVEEKKYEIDFGELKSQISFEDVLKFYSIELYKVDKAEPRGACPLPDCNGKRSFTVNFQRNLFKCHACGRGGDILDFVKVKEGLNFKEAGEFLTEKFIKSNHETVVNEPSEWWKTVIESTKLEIDLLEKLLEMKHALLEQLQRIDKQNTT